MKLLLHICCGPCSAYPIKVLKEQNIDFEGMFFNPNIHPYLEYKSRLESAQTFCANQNVAFEELEGYGLETYLKRAVFAENRCAECYAIRLERVAKEAKERGFDAFSTTLLVSPYQKHDLIIEIGNKMADKYGIKFYYQDFRPGFREGQQIARNAGLYMQKYCGCIYSEHERYAR
jgi:predicted adenine nucleotide alpha hydrolase (AANH) superfamily ATPase